MSQMNQQQSGGEDSFISGMKGAMGVVFGLFLVFVVLPCAFCGGTTLCAGVMSGASDYQEGVDEVRSESDRASGDDEAAEASATRTAAVGERFELGDFAYTIDDVGLTTQLGPELAPTEAQSNAVFVVVRYRIENLRNETATSLTGDFVLRDEQGREYRSSSDAEAALAMQDGADFLISELQPGLETDATVAFHVSEEATTEPLTLVVPEKGFTATDRVEVPFEFAD